MQTEITVLMLCSLLALVHIFSAVHYKTQQYGIDWSLRARLIYMPLYWAGIPHVRTLT